MKTKYIVFAIILVILIGAGIGLKMFFKPHADIRKLKTEYKVEASGLILEFEQDENAATAKYSEKILEISGNLVSKNKLPNGTNLLVLHDEMQGISCQLDSIWAAANKETIEALKTGKAVSVKGICKGYLMEIKVSPAIIVSK